ncbi:DNA polymerase III subunit gamma/tau [candidate division WOR-3 bacterium]|nr:DNA polymerase III subunit gamma/tau [candidate division WOR-3 bacterium]
MSDRSVLTLKYRPRSLDELLVQDHVRHTLARAIERGRLANAYLFAGPRGVGKTTTARILAKSINCLSFDKPTVHPCNTCSACLEIAESRSMDVLEIDGASNRGIDQVRELRENIKYAPASLRCKLYIIDEVHMLTEQAFNALLKTLEEPPAHARFVFATTEAHEVPATIISRCQRFDFRRATPDEVAARLRWLCEQEKIKASDAALLAIARRADGAIRDGESILEQLATFRPDGIESDDVGELLGLVPAASFYDYVDFVLGRDLAGIIRMVDGLFDKGYDLLEFYAGLIQHFRNIMFVQAGVPTDRLGLLPDERQRLADQAGALPRPLLVRALELLIEHETNTRHSQSPRVILEYASLELIRLVPAPPGPEPATNPAPEPAKPARARASADRRAARPAPKKQGPPAGGAGPDPVIDRMRGILGDIEEIG